MNRVLEIFHPFHKLFMAAVVYSANYAKCILF